MRLGASFFPLPGRVGALASKAEDLGLDAVTFGDSPVLAGELMVSLAEAAMRTSRIQVVAGVTNSVTRHASVMASAFCTLQVLGGGRLVCGIGRGDSAVRHAGLRPATVAEFEEYLGELRGYLTGPAPGGGVLSSLTELRTRGYPSVPLEIASTGPRTRAVALRFADRIALGTGSDPDHVRSQVREVEGALAAAGRSRDSVSIGAYLPAALHSDPATARRLAGYITAKFANFTAMRGQGSNALAGLPARLAPLAAQLGGNYSYAGDPGANVADEVPPELVEWMALVGSAGEVAERLQALADAGLDYVMLMTGFHQLDEGCQREMLDQLGGVVSRLAGRS
jgi:5,10-methylenetetrahydromethanopterin reductase